MKRYRWLVGLLLVFGTLAFAMDKSPDVDSKALESQTISLTDLAEKADLVAIAQVKDTDYVFTRSFPSEGSAFLKVLITYKVNRPGEEII